MPARPRNRRASRRPARKAPPPAVPFEGVVESLGARGDGIIRGEGGQVFAPLTLPGEQVRGQRSGERLSGIEVLEASGLRVTPPCPVFGTCGGCALQHMAQQALGHWKQDQVREALIRHGFDAPPMAPLIRVPHNARRRVTFSFACDRSGVTLGFQGRRSHTIVSAADCLILSPAIAQARGGLRALAEAAAGVAPSGVLHVLETDTGLDLDLRLGGHEPEGAARLDLLEAAQALDAARLTTDGEILAQWREPVLRMGGVAVLPPPGGFLQPSREGEAALVRLVTEGLEGSSGPVADLFSGCGTFTLPLAARCPVHAVEGDAASVSALDAALRHTSGLKPVTVEKRDLFQWPLTVKELARFEAVIFDPPRAGARAQAEALADARVPRIVAVSCNPATFARDLATLREGGYRLESVTPLDQFPWSPHIECVGVLRQE